MNVESQHEREPQIGRRELEVLLEVLGADLLGERVERAALRGAGPAGHQHSTSMRSIAARRSALDGRL